MKSDKKSRFLNYNERKLDFIPLTRTRTRTGRITTNEQNTKYKTHNWLTQKNQRNKIKTEETKTELELESETEK